MVEKINESQQPDPQALAADIQKNVNLLLTKDGSGRPPMLVALLKDPNAQAALDALHKDAMALLPDKAGIDSSPLQTNVLLELRKLEANSTLPNVQIEANGTIEAQQALPNYFISGGKGGPTLEQNTRTVEAAATTPATVNDYQPYDPSAPIPRVGPPPWHAK